MRRTLLPGLLAIHLLASGGAAQSRPADRAANTDMLRLSRPSMVLGEEEGTGPATFGGISASALDRGGRIYVLDYGDNSVRVFDARGRFLGRTGRPGRGPGDLAAPNRLIHDGDSTLYVTDEVNGLVEFRTRQGMLSHVRTYGAELRPRSACVFRGQVVVGGYRDARTVHFIGPDGRILRSIGEPFAVMAPPQVTARVDTIPALIELANRASVLLACSESESMIVVAQASGPSVRAYRPDGTEAWRLTLAEYLGNTHFRDGAGANIVVYGKDVTLSLMLIDDRTLLLQASRRESQRVGNGGSARLLSTQLWLASTLIDLRTGSVLGSTRSLPLLLAVRSGVAIEAEEEPFPRLRVREVAVPR